MLSISSLNPVYCSSWIEYEFSEKKGFAAYYDPVSIEKVGDLHTVKILKKYSQPKFLVDTEQEMKYSSTVATQVINCDNNIYKNKTIDLIENSDGSGKLIKSYDYTNKTNWNLMKKGSIQETLHKVICFNV